MISIDGSMGEGGGQVLRTSVALALVTGAPVRIDNIRAGRSKPGVMRQHRTALLAAADVSGSELVGGDVGATSVELRPGRIQAGEYSYQVGTAGSTTLVLQTVLPALLRADGPSTVRIEGGTHNPWSPPFEFLKSSLLPLMRRMGARVELTLDRHGFHPAGGGAITARIEPVQDWFPLELEERGETVSRSARILTANLPHGVGDREAKTIRSRLRWSEDEVRIQPIPHVRGPGNAVICSLESERVTETCCAFGSRGVSAEQVAFDAAAQIRSYMKEGAPVGTHLADQLMIPLALAGTGSYVAGPLSRHALTNLDVIRQFDVPQPIAEDAGERRTRIRIGD